MVQSRPIDQRNGPLCQGARRARERQPARAAYPMALSRAPISRALGTPAVERLREDTVLDGSTCARQGPVISEGPSRWRCGGGLSRRAVSRVLVTSAPTITDACDSTRL